MKKRVLAMMLSLAMVFSLLPMAAYAEDDVTSSIETTEMQSDIQEEVPVETATESDNEQPPAETSATETETTPETTETVPEEPDAVSLLQDRIWALPGVEEFASAEEAEQEAVSNEIQSILDEYEALSAEEQERLDISRLEALFAMFSASTMTEITITMDSDGVPTETSGTGWTYSSNKLNLNAGYIFTIEGTCKVTVENLGIIAGGTFDGTVNNTGTGQSTKAAGGVINGGTFNGEVVNFHGWSTCKINGGVFNGTVKNQNHGEIRGGTFNNTVTTWLGSNIYDGTFNGSMDLDLGGNINGGTFHKEVALGSGGYIKGGTFNSTVTWSEESNRYKDAIQGGSSTLTFVLNDGSWAEGYTVPASYSFSKYKTTVLPSSDYVKKEGFTFAGWFDNAELTGAAVTEIPVKAFGAKTFYAKWTEEPDAEYQAAADGEWLQGSFTDAVHGVYDGGTVRLLRNVTLAQTAVITKSVTITSADGTKMITSNTENHGYLLCIADSDQPTLTLANVILDGGSSSGISAARALIAVGGMYTGQSSSSTITGSGTVEIPIASNTSQPGRLVLNGAVIQNNNATQNSVGGGICVSCGSVEMNAGSKITNCRASRGGGVSVTGSAEFYMHGGVIDGCHAKDSGGGVYSYESSKFYMYQGTITRCSSGNVSGGVFVQHFLSVDGGTISECSAAKADGGIGISAGPGETAQATIKNAVITGNKVTDTYMSAWGAGIGISRANATLENCQITDNVCSGGFAGGVLVMSNVTLEMKNCTLSGNKQLGTYGGYGGGIGVFPTTSTPNTVVTLDNCTVTNNYARYGGGIAGIDCLLTLNNSKIYGNSAEKAGDDLVSTTAYTSVCSVKLCEIPTNLTLDKDGKSVAVTGWYDDGTSDVRWGTQQADGSYYCRRFEVPGEAVTSEIALKAAYDLNHKHSDYDTELKNQKDATCTEDGYTGDTCCKGCGDILEPGTVIPASHKWKSEWSYDESNHWNGCERCDATQNTGEHVFKWIIDKTESENETGLKHEECKVCHYEKAPIEIVTIVTFATDLTYNGKNQNLVLNGTTNGGTLVYRLSDTDEWQTEYEMLTGKDAGDYHIQYYVKDNDNNAVSKVQTATVTIKQKEVTVSGITAQDKTYDGNTTATLDCSNAVFNGIVSGDDLTVTANGAFKDKNVGEDKRVEIGGLSLGGTSTGNYKLAESGNQEIAKASITKRAITVKAKDASKIYGDADPELTYEVLNNGLVGSDTLKDIKVERDKGEDVKVGGYKINVAYNGTIVQSLLSAFGSDPNGNYTITYVPGVFTINSRDISGATVTLGNSLTYNGKEQIQTISKVVAGGIEVPADAYTVTGNTAKDAGTYTLTITAKEGGNFIGKREVSYTIAKADEKPTDPTKPTNPTKPGQTESPKTGDSSRTFLWFALMLVGTCGLTGTILVSRKTRYKGRYTK